jgi:hypothetical protein
VVGNLKRGGFCGVCFNVLVYRSLGYYFFYNENDNYNDNDNDNDRRLSWNICTEALEWVVRVGMSHCRSLPQYLGQSARCARHR